GHLESGVAHGVGDGFDVQRELALVRQRAHLVGLVDTDDAGDAGEIAQVRHGAHRPAGWNSGSVTSSVSFWKTTSTGMSHISFCSRRPSQYGLASGVIGLGSGRSISMALLSLSGGVRLDAGSGTVKRWQNVHAAM